MTLPLIKITLRFSDAKKNPDVLSTIVIRTFVQQNKL